MSCCRYIRKTPVYQPTDPRPIKTASKVAALFRCKRGNCFFAFIRHDKTQLGRQPINRIATTTANPTNRIRAKEIRRLS